VAGGGSLALGWLKLWKPAGSFVRSAVRGWYFTLRGGDLGLGVRILLVSLLPSGLSIFCLHGSSGALGLTNSGPPSH
jgi:hypothetical protein